MPPPEKCPAFATISQNDAGARLSHLQDLIAEAAGDPLSGLSPEQHEAAAAGAMRSPADSGVILLTLISRAGSSHVFALSPEVAKHIRAGIDGLRLQHPEMEKHRRPARDNAAPVLKPGGHLL